MQQIPYLQQKRALHNRGTASEELMVISDRLLNSFLAPDMNRIGRPSVYKGKSGTLPGCLVGNFSWTERGSR
jgi:hypothetical protein